MTAMTLVPLEMNAATVKQQRLPVRAGAEPVRALQRRDLGGRTRLIDRGRLATGCGKQEPGNRKHRAVSAEDDSVPGFPFSSSRVRRRRYWIPTGAQWPLWPSSTSALILECKGTRARSTTVRSLYQ